MNEVVRSIDFAFVYIIGISVLLLLFITGVMIYFAVRYRRAKNPTPSDIRDNWKLEVAWTVLPVIIALSMFYFGWDSYLGLRNVPPGALEINVIGVQYSWIFEYPESGKESGTIISRGSSPISGVFVHARASSNSPRMDLG